LIESVLPVTLAPTYIHWLVAQRYQQLVDHQLIPVNTTIMASIGNECHGGHATMMTKGYRRFGRDLKDFQRGLSKLIPLFNQMHTLAMDTPDVPLPAFSHAASATDAASPSSPLVHPELYPEIDYTTAVQSYSIVQLLLGNYIEHMLHAVLGLESIYPFLYHCYITSPTAATHTTTSSHAAS
jgi:hypothetical protein